MPKIGHSTLITAGIVAACVGMSSMAGGVAVAAGGGLAPPPADPATIHRPLAAPDRIMLTPSADPATTQSVTWRTSDAVTTPRVQWAVPTAGPATVAGSVDAETTAHTADLGYQVRFHTATLTGLEPDTAYLYRVGDGETWSEWLEFRTAATDAGGFSFLIQGDAQNDNRAYTSRAFRAAFEARPYAKLALHVGDLIDTDTSDAEWGEWNEAVRSRTST